jgi:hypothetical protein
MLRSVLPLFNQGWIMGLSSNSLQELRCSAPYRLASGSDPDGPRKVKRADRSQSAHEDLPYKVELWDMDKKSVEQVLAVTASGSIGYAAYYAAAREYPDRYVTLRHKNGIVARSNGPDR